MPVLYCGDVMEKIEIGKIVNAVGLKGEVKVYNYSDSADIYMETQYLYAEDEMLEVENVRLQKNVVIVKFAEINDRNASEAMKGKTLYITEEDLPELTQGQFYVRDLIGMTMVDSKGDILGKVTDVIQNTAQDIFEVEKKDGKKFLVPKVDEFVKNIDAEKKLIEVSLIEGLMDL